MFAIAVTDRHGAGDTIIAWGTGAHRGDSVCTIPHSQATRAPIFTDKRLALVAAVTSKYGIAGAVWWLAAKLVAGAIVLTEVFTGGHGSLTQWSCPVAVTET